VRRLRVLSCLALAGLAACAGARGPEPYSLIPTGRAAAADAGTWEEWYLDAGDGCTLYVKEVGRGDPLVVLHGGWGAEHGYLLDAFAGLEAEYRLIFYDQRGSLRSPCPDTLVSIERHVRDLERLRGELAIDRMVLVGHSMGTFLAMSYLDAHPARVRGLVMLGALIPRSPAGEEELNLYREQEASFVTWARAAEAAQVQREGLDRPDLSEKERTYRWRIGFAAGNIYHVERWRRMTGGQVFYSASAGRAAGRGMDRGWNFVLALERFPHPVTVINGDHDLVGFGGALHRRMLRDLPNVEFVLIERAGHNAWIDQPETFRAQLVRALDRYR
jgi:proline iminopeptidase